MVNPTPLLLRTTLRSSKSISSSQAPQSPFPLQVFLYEFHPHLLIQLLFFFSFSVVPGELPPFFSAFELNGENPPFDYYGPLPKKKGGAYWAYYVSHSGHVLVHSRYAAKRLSLQQVQKGVLGGGGFYEPKGQ